MEAARTLRAWTFRVENIPPETTAERLKDYFHTEDQPYIQVRSIVPAVDCEGPDGELTATISFQTRDETITAPRVLDDTISVDSDFHGFTPLSQPKGPIAADIIAVTGLAAHAYGSWAHSSRNMWLRDYLTKDVPNARVLIYGYPSQLQGSASSGILADHTNNFIHRLLSMRELARCQDRPIVFIGHSLGCLIIKKALSDVNGSIARYSSCLPVCAMIFFGAPHRGLQTTALETLVKSQPTEEMLRELRARSPTLNDLNDKFRFVANDIDILTCFELLQTKTAVEMPDGSWKREGKPEMMVYQDSAQLNFPKEKMVSCHADHSQMAKLRRGESGAYPDIKRAIKQALLHVAEEQADVGLSRLQLQSGVKDVVEERSRHNGDSIKGSGPERTPVPTGKSPLDDLKLRLELCSASKEGDAEKVRSLLAQGCSIHESSEDLVDVDKDAFLLAAQNGRLDVLKVLLEHNCDISKRALPHGNTALHLISFDPEIKPKPVIESLVIVLLGHGVPIDARTSRDCTALVMSAFKRKVFIAECLLEHGADIHAADKDGNTALSWPAVNGYHEVVALLISKGAPLETRTKGKCAYTPLHSSCLPRKGTGESARLLLQAGADKEAISASSMRALHLAARSGNLGVVNELLAFEVEVDTADDNEWRALHHAKQWGHWRIIEALLAKSANPSLLNKHGERPSKVAWHPDAIIYQVDKEECLKLLKHAEEIWEEKQRQEMEKFSQAMEKQIQQRKGRRGGVYSRIFASLWL